MHRIEQQAYGVNVVRLGKIFISSKKQTPSVEKKREKKKKTEGGAFYMKISLDEEKHTTFDTVDLSHVTSRYNGLWIATVFVRHTPLLTTFTKSA